MKRVLALVASAALACSTFAVSFDLSGYIRGGISATLDHYNNEDGDTDESAAYTDTWLAGDYFGGGSRLRINADLASEDEKEGLSMRFQYDGAFEDISFSNTSVKYAYGWAKFADGLVTVEAGKLTDNYLSPCGWEDGSIISGNAGVVVALKPASVEGLTLAAAYTKDWLEKNEKILGNDASDETALKEPTEEGLTFGARFESEGLTLTAAYSLDGLFDAGVVYGNDTLFASFEAFYQSDDANEEGDAPFSEGSTWMFVENVEYSGVENLTLGLAAYEYILNDNDDSLVANIIPAVRYEVNELIAVSLESTIYLINKSVDDFDSFATIVPALTFKASDTCEVTGWAQFCTDSDIGENTKIGVGLIKEF